ncbi:hypothetical protein NIES2098_03150 [Calothrix sp. NIES-2098]|nr:hypothetical protein NIES2098_03150 [Calothrix sp. NIES-2098]
MCKHTSNLDIDGWGKRLVGLVRLLPTISQGLACQPEQLSRFLKQPRC